MALPRERIGGVGQRAAVVDPGRARAYAEATNDRNPAYLDGRYAPPVFGVVPTWEPLLEVVGELIPAGARASLVHAEQDMRFHRPLVPGMMLETVAEGYSVRVAGPGTWVTARLRSDDQDGALVLETYSTMFVRGMTGGGAWGPERPRLRFPAAARPNRAAEVVRPVDQDQTFRYRDASGDTNPIHVDDAAARAAGFPGIVLHGLCTMAMCGAAVVDSVAGGDPARLARLAVRFSKPVYPGHDLVVSVHSAGDDAYAFEARSDGNLVVRDGWAEVRA
jgi:acyl dehydratase